MSKIPLFLAFVVCSVVAHSDEFGRNPQHDFGSVTGRVTNPVLPFWTMLGDAFANEDVVRLTPDRQSKTGAVWNSQRLMWDNWEVMVKFNVHGVSPLGADGFAFWLAREVNTLGKFFGFVENFHGIGVVVDTYDNDGTGQHPIINVLQNSGEKSYEHHHEGGKHHGGEMELGHCSFSVRNQKQNTFMLITYDKKTFSVKVKKEDSSDWTVCVTAPDVQIEKGLYLGLSAATGHLADNHDILGVTVRNLDPDAQFFDSEQRFAQFSKYTIAESLGRIQSDIRGSLFSLASSSQPIHAQANTASTSQDNQAILVELASLKRELGSIVSTVERSLGNAPIAPTAPVSDARELREIQASLKTGVKDLSSETQKITSVQSKLERIISSLENLEKTRIRLKDSPPESSGKTDLSLFFYFIFIVFFLAAAYVAFLFYRTKSKSPSQKMV